MDRIKSRRLLDARTGSFDEIMRVLREEGGLRNVEAVRFEEVPVEEQFHKVMRARILVAVHGAGLTNMIFQPPFDSSVVEIVFSPRKVQCQLQRRRRRRCRDPFTHSTQSIAPPIKPTHLHQPDYPNMARTIGRGYHYVWAERAEELYVTPGEKAPNPINYRRVYVDSRKLLASIKVRDRESCVVFGDGRQVWLGLIELSEPHIHTRALTCQRTRTPPNPNANSTGGHGAAERRHGRQPLLLICKEHSNAGGTPREPRGGGRGLAHMYTDRLGPKKQTVVYTYIHI